MVPFILFIFSMIAFVTDKTQLGWILLLAFLVTAIISAALND